MSTNTDATTEPPLNPTEHYQVHEHTTPEALADAAGINERTASRLFNVAAQNNPTDTIVEMDTDKGRWLIEKLTGVNTNAVIGRAQATGPNGILVQNAAPTSKVSYSIGQMRRNKDENPELATGYYHAAHSRVHLPSVAADDDLNDNVYFGVHPTSDNTDTDAFIGEWLPKQYITAVHTINPESARTGAFLITNTDDTLVAARGDASHADIYIGNECEPFTGTKADGTEITQRKLEIKATEEYLPLMKALYEPTYTTYDTDLKRWRGTLTELETIIDHLCSHGLTVAVSPVVSQLANTFNIDLKKIYNRGGKPVTDAAMFEPVTTDSCDENKFSESDLSEFNTLDDLPKLNDELKTSRNTGTNGATKDTTVNTPDDTPGDTTGDDIKDDFKDLLE